MSKKHTINAMVFKMTGISNNQLAIFSKTTGECLLNLSGKTAQDQTMSRDNIFGLFKNFYHAGQIIINRGIAWCASPSDPEMIIIPEGLLGVISPTGESCIFTRNHYERVDACESLCSRALQQMPIRHHKRVNA